MLLAMLFVNVSIENGVVLNIIVVHVVVVDADVVVVVVVTLEKTRRRHNSTHFLCRKCHQKRKSNLRPVS
jgi:hypothetical protein